MILSTICYIEQDGKYLMLLRNKKEKDVNEGKWIGVGGKFLDGESPEECMLREVEEETGLIADEFQARGILTFSSKGWEQEYIHVFTISRFHGTLRKCTEGELHWIEKEKILDLALWEGDKIFLPLLIKGVPYFSLKLEYEGDDLVRHRLYTYDT